MTETQPSGSATPKRRRVLAYVPDKDLADMTDEEIEEFAARVVADARIVLRPSRGRAGRSGGPPADESPDHSAG